MKLYHYADWPIPLRENSRYPINKFKQLVDRTRTRFHSSDLELLVAERAPRDALARIHDETFIDAVLNQTLTEKEQREMGFPNSLELAERAQRIAGASIAAAISAQSEGISGVLGGGAHHSYAERGRGFCVFNDIAIAASTLLEQGIERILIFDCDVHQGDGTAAIYRNETRVFTVSIHAESNYPFRKEVSDLDIGLQDDVTDSEYQSVIVETLEKSLELTEPQFVFYLAGADPFIEDTLGRLSISQSGLAARDHFVLQKLHSLGIPTCILLGGGYCNPIDMTVTLNLQTFEIASSFQHRSLVMAQS